MVNDRQLAERFAASGGGDAELRAVYARFGRAVYTVTYSILRDPGRAADAAQTAFVNAWRAADRFDGTRDLGPWLYAIARRTAVDIHRRERRLEPTDPAALAAVPAAVGSGAGDGADRLERSWEAWHVRLAVDDLPADEREVVRLAWFDELTHAEIADRLEIPVGTVKSRAHRARQRLTNALAHLRADADGNRADDRGVQDAGDT